MHFPIGELTEITARLAWAQLEVFGDHVEDIQILVAGDEGSVTDLRIEVNDGALLVEQPQYGLSLNIMESRWMQVCIRIPMEWQHEIHLNTISGLLRARCLEGSRIKVDTISGDLRVERINAKELSMKTISSDVRAEVLKAENIVVRSVSGNLIIDAIAAESVRGSSISGEQIYHFTQAFSNIDVTAVSGNVIITSPEESLNISMRSVSGRIQTDGVKKTEDKNAPKVRATCVSADLKLMAIKGASDIL